MTFAELFEWVEKNNIDWQSEIYYERIEDWYFETSSWAGKSLKIKGDMYNHCKTLNEKIDSGELYDKTQYPHIIDPEKYRTNEMEMEKMKDEYVKVETVINYEPNKIFLTAHY